MRARWKRIYVTVALVTMVGFAYHNRESAAGAYNSLQPEFNSIQSSEKTKYEDEGSIVEWSHPSVFQQWREHQPPRLVQSSYEDCIQLRRLRDQQMCYQRLEQVRQHCSKRQAEEQGTKAFSDLAENGDTPVQDSVVDVFSYQQKERVVMYCSVHKVASTFWIGLFRFLHNDTSGKPVSSPDVLSKQRVHLTPFRQSRPLALAYLTRKLQPEKQQFRFMFTRNPYHRLWAVYIDKFVLPDFFFWTHHASVIQDMVLEKLDEGSTKKPSKQCFDVSFENFVAYTVQEESSSFVHSDDHMLPVSKVCNPCAFQPHFIGQLENMTQDSQAVLDRLNLSHIVSPTDFQERAVSYMHIITDFVYDTVAYQEGLRHCVSDRDIQARITRAFVLCGYLPPDVAEVTHTPVAKSPTHMFKIVRDIFFDSNRDEEEVETQRKKLMVHAYSALPWDLVYRVRDYYKEDFHMFGYDPEPPELFARREERERKALL